MLRALVVSSCVLLGGGCVDGYIKAPTPSGPVTTVKPDVCADVTPAVGAWPLQRLTSLQLERTVQTVLHDSTRQYQQRLGSTDEVVDSRLRYSLAYAGNDVVAEGLMLAAENVAVAAVANPALQAEFACAASDLAGERACAKLIVERLGKRLWRRALLPADVDGVLAVYELSRTDSGTYLEGVQAAVQSLLAAPDFFFLQQPVGQSGAAAKLTGWVLAERLALTLWQQAPDDALLDAAQAGTLDTAEGLEHELDRLLQDPRANASFAEFLKHWLSPEKTSSIEAALATASRAPSLYTHFTPPSDTNPGDGLAFGQALDVFFANTATARSGTLHDLMLDDHLIVNEAVARNLNLPLPAAGQTETRAPDTNRRRGVLGQPAVLTAFGRFEASDPVHRGVFLIRQAMCRPLNPPDMMVNTTLPEATQFKTTRDRFTAATKDAACAGCHGSINPLGFSFENFDAVGNYREQENGNPVDATATLPILGKDGTKVQVDGLAELAAVLADDVEVRDCLSRQFAVFALHRGLTQAESCALKAGTASFAEGPGSFQTLIRSVVSSPSFTEPLLP